MTVDQWPIRGGANEWTTIELSLSALFSAYGRTRMVERVTLDAGNATPEAAKKLEDRDVDYFMAVKTPQWELHCLAQDTLAELAGNKADFCVRVDERGKMICYSVWSHQLTDACGLEGAKQVFRIERVVADDEDVSVGNRYFVSSEEAGEVDAKKALELARSSRINSRPLAL